MALMIDLTDKSQLINYLKKHKLWAKKGLSQNFLVDEDALGKIVEAAELKTSDLVIEVGAGTGVLTQELVKRAGEVIAIELDLTMASLLKNVISNPFDSAQDRLREKSHVPEDLSPSSNPPVGGFGMARDDKEGRLKIINADILKLNLNEIIGNKPYKVVANIPYHITSKILELFLSRENKPELMVLLVQKEVAERICAKPGDLSILAISVQLYGRPEIIDVAPKESFFPSPEVDSAILRIARIQNIEYSSQQEKEFFRLVHIGFAAKRKTLVNNLMAGYHLERKKVIGIIKMMGLKDTVRAQELGIAQWKNLTEAIKDAN